jgi:hypothetical protein
MVENQLLMVNDFHCYICSSNAIPYHVAGNLPYIVLSRNMCGMYSRRNRDFLSFSTDREAINI